MKEYESLNDYFLKNEDKLRIHEINRPIAESKGLMLDP